MLDLAVIPQISDQIIFAFIRRLVIDEKRSQVDFNGLPMGGRGRGCSGASYQPRAITAM